MNLSKITIFLLILLLPAIALAGYNVKTCSTLQAEVRYCLATDADPYHPNDTLKAFINIACREVASYGTIIKMDSVVVEAEDMIEDLNDDVLEVVAVFPCTATASQALERIPFRLWGRVGGAIGLSKTEFYAFQPQNKFVGGDCYTPKLWLYPEWSEAEDTLTVVYYAQANELSSATDTTLIPYQYTPLVVYYAVALSLARAGDYNKPNWWFALYDKTRAQKGLLRQLDYIIHPKEINK